MGGLLNWTMLSKTNHHFLYHVWACHIRSAISGISMRGMQMNMRAEGSHKGQQG